MFGGDDDGGEGAARKRLAAREKMLANRKNKSAEALASKKKETGRRKEVLANADQSTVSGRIQKSSGMEGFDSDRTKATIEGAKFGEAVLGDGLGRIGDDETMSGIEDQAAEMAKGFSSKEMMVRKEKALEGITSGTQSQSRAAQAAMARSGVKGQAAGAQMGQIAQQGVQSRGNLERDLVIEDRMARERGLAGQAELVSSNRRFDIGQEAKEKNIALQAGMGFAQMDATEKGAALNRASQERASRASSGGGGCFIEGTEIATTKGVKKIEDIMLGDTLMAGGVVYSLFKAITSTIYDYKGVEITGGHAVLEEDKWVRIEDSVYAFKKDGLYVVYNLSNEDHRIVVENVTFADYDETDLGTGLSDKESLEALNGKCDKILEGRRRV